MRKIILLLLFIATTINVSAKSLADTSHTVVLKLNEHNVPFLKDGYTPASLPPAELTKVKAMIDKAIADHNSMVKDTVSAQLIRTPDRYYRQLLPMINKKGEKEVLVNCFCDKRNKSYWKRDLVIPWDGGICFFRFKLNLATGVAYDFNVNGM